MTIDETIEILENKVQEMKSNAIINMDEGASNLQQIADWLKEYKQLKRDFRQGFEAGKAETIDEYRDALIEAYNQTDLRSRGIYFDNVIVMMANAIKEQK